MQCPICSATVEENKVLQRHEQSRLLECLACHIQFWFPMKQPGKEWYEKSDIYGGRAFGANKRRVYWNHQQLLDEPLAKGDLIDIGCGTGSFLAAAQQKGYSITGIDFDAEAVEKTRAVTGCNRVFVTSVEEFLAESPQRFDVASFFEVLEHLEDPRAFLLQVKKLLKPGGHIGVTVPNRKRWPRVLNLAGVDLPPHHLTRWDTASLKATLEQCGFEVVTLREQSMDTQSVLSCLFWMLPYRILWHRMGKKLSQSRSYAQAKPANPSGLRRLLRTGLIAGVRGAYVLHRLALIPLAAVIAAKLRADGVPGMGLYACARVKR